MKDKKIGFIGQGWIGKNYADNFEARGYEVVRYGLEEPYRGNKEKIKDCDIVFIAVPTPTTPQGFDDSIVREAVKLVGLGQTAVIKSTILPGTTQSIQQENPEIFVMHSPEFLSERTAADDAAHPGRNLVGIPVDNEIYRQKAAQVLASLPPAPVSQVMAAREAELFKYLRNCFFYTKVIFMNLVYDLALKNNCRWEVFREIMSVDPWIGNMHIDPVHKSGRGAGGGCFIKDFAAFAQFYRQLVGDEPGCRLLEAMEQKNIDLLVASGKNLNILAEVYGESAIKK
jgi:UDPglucose 6-dehydrogenase